MVSLWFSHGLPSPQRLIAPDNCLEEVPGQRPWADSRWKGTRRIPGTLHESRVAQQAVGAPNRVPSMGKTFQNHGYDDHPN